MIKFLLVSQKILEDNVTSPGINLFKTHYLLRKEE